MWVTLISFRTFICKQEAPKLPKQTFMQIDVAFKNMKEQNENILFYYNEESECSEGSTGALDFEIKEGSCCQTLFQRLVKE